MEIFSIIFWQKIRAKNNYDLFKFLITMMKIVFVAAW